MIIFILTSLLFLQAPDTLWTRTFGFPDRREAGCSGQETTDNGFVCTGPTDWYAINSDIFLIKTDRFGNILWQKTYGGDLADAAYSIQQTKDGGYIMCGTTASFGAEWWDVYLVKVDSLGNFHWQQTSGVGYDAGYFVQQTQDNGYIATGYWIDPHTMRTILILYRYDSLGNERWFRTFGEYKQNHGSCVKQTSDNGFIITGWTTSYGAIGYDVYLIKTDSGGGLVWQKTLGGNSDDHGHSVQQTADGGYIIAGTTMSFGTGHNDVYLLRTDSSGNLQWQKTFGGRSSDEGRCVQQTSDGGFIVTGYTSSIGAGNNDVYVVKTDSLGNLKWYKTLGGSNYDHGNSVQPTADGGYIVIGTTKSFNDTAGDAYLIRLKSETSVEEVNISKIKAKLLVVINPTSCKDLCIKYSVLYAADVKLILYNSLGRTVETLIDRRVGAGNYVIKPNKKINSGVYFVRLETNGEILTRKIVLVE